MSATTQVHLSAPRGYRERPPEVLSVTVERDERLLLSVAEAARRLGIGRTLMYELLAAGQIQSVHVGRLHKVPARALDAYVARLTADGD